ncbi:MAG: CAP domain-containing protein [Actinomycetota bacterium]
MLGLMLTFVLVSLSALPALAAGADPATVSFNQDKMLEFLNAERAARGVSPVVRDPSLEGPARQWAEKLAAERRGYHNQIIPAFEAGYASGAENLAWGPTLNAAQAHLLWMTSDVDRRSILDPAFSSVGIGLACSTASGRPFVVAVLELGGGGAPASEIPSAQPRVAGNESMSGRNVSCGEAEIPAASSLSGSRVVAVPVTEPSAPAEAEIAAVGSKGPGAAEPVGVAQAPAGDQDNSTLVLAAVVAALMCAVFLVTKAKISEARLAASIGARPRLDTEKLADLLEDYRID